MPSTNVANSAATTQCASANCYSDYHVYPIKPMIFGVKFGQKF